MNPTPYQEAFPVGKRTRVADREFLEHFMATWPYHNKITPDQLDYSSTETIVESVGFCHGGDPVYVPKGVPGHWLEQCLRPVPGETYVVHTEDFARPRVGRTAKLLRTFRNWNPWGFLRESRDTTIELRLGNPRDPQKK